MPVRIRFSKTDTACFISHLDLVRCMTRAFQRAGISVRRSQGYNPRPHIVFAAPVSLGIESTAELMDGIVEQDLSPAEIMQRLNGGLPRDIRVSDVYEDGMPFRQISEARYILKFPEQYARLYDSFVNADRIMTVKKTKHGPIQTDIKPYVNIERFDIGPAGADISLILPTGPDYNISMRVFLGAFFDSFENDEQIFYACRTDFFDKNGKLFR